MALIDEVKKVCKDLAPHGWSGLLSAHGLDISRNDLGDALNETLAVDRTISGFRDFALEGVRGIEPGVPSQSLLYHALASPNVKTYEQGRALTKFPTPKQIEAVENYVYASTKRTLVDVLDIISGMPHFAIAVFAVEYRPRQQTSHRAHADLCFSRTGVARVGALPPHYVPEMRGYVSLAPGDDPKSFRVRPARYAPFIAVQMKGDVDSFGPARFDLGVATGQSAESDSTTDFWVPLHKLFDGDECFADRSITVDVTAEHTNEKLRRIHQERMGLKTQGFDSGHHTPKIDGPPFRYHEDIAEFSTEVNHGSHLLVPDIHPSFVGEVRDEQGNRIGANVPEVQGGGDFSPTYLIPSSTGARRAPEYVHVRDKILANGNLDHFNEQRNVQDNVDAGGYSAQHYHDFTGDGWVLAECAQIASRVPRSVPAYSLVAAPDFFPLVGQGELMDWWISSAANAFRFSIWWQAFPFSLSDQRTAPNLAINETAMAMFRPEDISVSALISPPLPVGQTNRQITQSEPSGELRHSHMPDYASGYYAPGWDTSFARNNNGDEHLASFGLGSPFPEDAKLCAALSTYWPAAAPDSSRQYATRRPLVAPLTDEEVGLGAAPSWDGNRGGIVVTRDSGTRVVEYTREEYVDYVKNSIDAEFSIATTSKVTFEEYVARLLAMHRAYQAVGEIPPRPDASGTIPNSERERWTRARALWSMISFVPVDQTDPDVVAAASDGHPLGGIIYRIHLYRQNGELNHPNDFRKVHIRIGAEKQLLVDPRPRALVKSAAGKWERVPVI